MSGAAADAAATEAEIDASQAEASAAAAAESAIVAATVAAGTAAVAEQEAAATVASYEERLAECQDTGTQLRNDLASGLSALRSETAALRETLSLIQTRLEPSPEPNPPNPAAAPASEPVPPPEETAPASEPEPVKPRRKAHHWI
jgi:hypothetical protein